MPSIAALNLGHATRPKRLPTDVIRSLKLAGAETLVFSEYVDQKYIKETRSGLAEHGYQNVIVSEVCEYTKGRWHNQILVASTDDVGSIQIYTDGPSALCATNTLSFNIQGYSITGLRIPMRKTGSEWNVYWDWIEESVATDIVIGDFNCDPSRNRPRDRRLVRYAELNEMRVITGENSPSYIGKNGTFSTVDHAVVRSTIRVNSAVYLHDGIVPQVSDHAALLIDFD